MSETQKEEEEEYKGVVLYGKWLYAFIGVSLFVLSTVSFNAYTAHNEARKVNTQLTQEKASTGAKIEFLLNNRTSNRNKWTEEQKVIDSAMIKQAKLNSSTEQIEAQLEKMNISIIR